MSKNLNFLGNFYTDLGIPKHTRELAVALSKKLDNLKIVQIIPGNDTMNLDNRLKKFVGQIDMSYPTLTFWYPNSFERITDKNIGYYIFEYTKIPKAFVEKINQLDIICTASDWGCNVLKENNVKIPIVKVRGGVDSNYFAYVDRSKLNVDKIKYLHIGKMEERKGTELVIRAFNEAFKGSNKVSLTLSIDNPHNRFITAEYFLYSLDLNYSIDNIEIVHYVKDIRTLYNTHHIGVFPSLAEGIGLPIVEAMSTGMLVIAPNNSGISEYIRHGNAIILSLLEEVPVYDPIFFPNAGEFGIWKKPSMDELINHLRTSFYNYELYCYGRSSSARADMEQFSYELYCYGRSRSARADMEQFSWESAADSLIGIL